MVVSNVNGSATSSVAMLTLGSPSLFSDNQESYASPVQVTGTATTNGYKIAFGAASGPEDFKAIFGFDAATVNLPTTVPTGASFVSGGSKALYLTVNKDATAAVGSGKRLSDRSDVQWKLRIEIRSLVELDEHLGFD